eukprot:TRINITY_DN4943_c0_g1_i1.p1 TRINITY_DN4943_c0_g1~~TRINITY_DN4943_c0_g1_i1.p1  ORF type:complete len:231 (-),score=51.35 TRINITY_DN4943_c0_g1_i1:397-1089(-)
MKEEGEKERLKFLAQKQVEQVATVKAEVDKKTMELQTKEEELSELKKKREKQVREIDKLEEEQNGIYQQMLMYQQIKENTNDKIQEAKQKFRSITLETAKTYKQKLEVINNAYDGIKAKLEKVAGKLKNLEAKLNVKVNLSTPEERENLLEKIKNLIKLQQTVSQEERSLLEKKQKLEHEITQLQGQHAELINRVKSGKLPQKRLWKFAIYTPVSIVGFLVLYNYNKHNS